MKEKMSLSIVILAGGLGSRMKSNIPKWMHIIHGKPILEWILQSCVLLHPDHIYVIVSENNQDYLEFFSSYSINKIIQEQPLGTGHAVQCFVASVDLPENEKILILNGDVPFIKADRLQEMLDQFKGGCMLTVSELSDPTGYGRVFLDDRDRFEKIIEQKDLKATQTNSLCNMGIYIWSFSFLQERTKYLTNENQSHEYYITDLYNQVPFCVELFYLDPSEKMFFYGINTPTDLELLEKQIYSF